MSIERRSMVVDASKPEQFNLDLTVNLHVTNNSDLRRFFGHNGGIVISGSDGASAE
jgi:hypothetical protein